MCCADQPLTAGAGKPSPTRMCVHGGATQAATTNAATSTSAAATGSGSGAPTASAVALGGPPACTIAAQKSWTTGASKSTGLTASELPDGRVAIGFAVGITPHILVI